MKTSNAPQVDRVRIVKKRPPFWRLLKLIFPKYDPDGTIAVSFGKVVYSNKDFADEWHVHEGTHLRQQKHSYLYAVLWWIKYLCSKEFRYEQELEAFAEQYRYIYQLGGNTHSPHVARHLASELCGPLYGIYDHPPLVREYLQNYAEED